MNAKKIILLVIGVFTILLSTKTEIYTHWLDNFIMQPDIDVQFQHMSVEERREYRFNNLYSLSKYVKQTLDTIKGGPEPVVLLPPTKYLQANGIDYLGMPEPVVFYYHTGHKAVWTNSPTVRKANWALVKTDKSVALVPLKDPRQLDQLLAIYKDFKPEL
ncbi:MAG: hypothetical protein EBZ77_14690 [Chitinophagia bacterium]|nr:hypothetical protein [Chitinophagia bacterium]